YLAKPFAFSELVARIRALGRRTHPAVAPVMIHGDLTFDTARRTVKRAGREIPLSGKEFGVLEVLLGAKGTLVTSEDLLERVWDVHRGAVHQGGRGPRHAPAPQARRPADH